MTSKERCEEQLSAIREGIETFHDPEIEEAGYAILSAHLSAASNELLAGVQFAKSMREHLRPSNN